MNDVERKFIVKDTPKKELSTTEVRGVKCWTVAHTDYGGHTEDELEFTETQDGFVCVSNGDQWVYINPQAIDVLKRFLVGVAPQLTGEAD